jgi:hypothetical protein
VSPGLVEVGVLVSGEQPGRRRKTMVNTITMLPRIVSILFFIDTSTFIDKSG